MAHSWSRRNVLKLAAAVAPAGTLGLSWEPEAAPALPADFFPTQPPELVREIVTVSHFDLKRVKELVEARPSLARASWDWGFGDWESALGAASHMGNRPIAEYLISKGGRPSLFSAAMLGHLEVVKAFLLAQPGVQRIRGPHGISLLEHARAGGDAARAVLEFLRALGDADALPPVPLAESDARALQGVYLFGPGPSQQIDVGFDRGRLSWTRKGTMVRPLVHLGNRVFHPAGADAVRIRFAEEGDLMVMTVSDPDVVVTARRKREPNTG